MEDFVIRVGKKGKDGNSIYRVMIYDHTEGRGNIDVTVADSGRMESTPDGRYLIFTLYNGYNYKDIVDQKDARKTQPFQRTNFRYQQRKFDLSAFELNRTNEDLFKNNYQMLNISQLNYFIDSISSSISERRAKLATQYAKNYKVYLLFDSTYQAGEDTSIVVHPGLISGFDNREKAKIMASALNAARSNKKTLTYHIRSLRSSEEYLVKHKIVWHRKFTLSFACLVLFFIGAPLGAIIRKGGLGLPTVVSILFFILYHIISMIGEKSSLKGAIEVSYGMWLSSIILLPLGIFLTVKATTDSPIMDMDLWNKFALRINPLRFFPRLRNQSGRKNGKSPQTGPHS
jgi:lipopolysaccharide export system permease protein